MPFVSEESINEHRAVQTGECFKNPTKILTDCEATDRMSIRSQTISSGLKNQHRY